MTPEDRLYKRLDRTKNSKDNDSAVREVFKSFANYYGEKADQDREKAKRALIGVFAASALLLMFLFSCLC